MNKFKFDFSTLKQVTEELNSKIKSSFISGITLISSNDIIMTFSHYRKEKLLISLNHETPFLSLISLNESFSTILNQTSETLRREIKEAKILNIELINNDRILKIELSKTNDYFQLEKKYLIIEFIPHRPNLILLNESNKIIFASHYKDLTNERPIIKGGEYIVPNSNLTNYEDGISSDDFKQLAKEYIDKAKTQRRKDKFTKLVTHINSKIKSLKTKIKKIEKEIEKSKENLNYKDYGDYALSAIYDESLIDEYIKNGFLKDYQNDLSIKDNANRYYKLYKKAKSSIEHGEIEIKKANEEIEYFSHIKIQVELGDDEDLLQLQETLIPNKNKKNSRKLPTFSPHYIVFENIKIAFGKTDIQNNELTFKRSKPNYIFLHIKDYSGAHVVVFNPEASNEVLTIASETALLLSKKESGDVQICKIKDVRKGDKVGQVNLKSYKNIYISKVRKSTKELLENSSRF